MSEEFEYNRINGGLILEAEEWYMLNYTKTLVDCAMHFKVNYDSLRKFAQKGNWTKRRDEFFREKSADIKEKIRKELNTDQPTAIELEILRQLFVKHRHSMAFKAMDAAIVAHFTPHADESDGSVTPVAVDTIAKLGPVLIKRAEHELRKQSHAEFTQNNRAKPAEDSSDPPVDDGAVSNALQRLEEQPD